MSRGPWPGWRGKPPTAYLLGWRMARAKQQLLRQQTLPMAEIVEQVGYRSVGAFGVAFTRPVGRPPGRYARDPTAVEAGA